MRIEFPPPLWGRVGWGVVAVMAIAAAAALFGPDRTESYDSKGLRMSVPEGATVHEDGSAKLRRYRVESPGRPPLIVEQHLGAKLEPAAHLERLSGRDGAVRRVRLGAREAAEAAYRTQGTVFSDPRGAASAPERERTVFAMSANGALIVASFDRPSSPWRRWRLERLYRKVLSTLEVR